jgi:hypothetical protein
MGPFALCKMRTLMKSNTVSVFVGVSVWSVWVGAVPPAPGQPSGVKNTCHVNSSVQASRVAKGFGAPFLAPLHEKLQRFGSAGSILRPLFWGNG